MCNEPSLAVMQTKASTVWRCMCFQLSRQIYAQFRFCSFAEIFAIHLQNVCVQSLFTVDKIERERYNIENASNASLDASSKIDSIHFDRK